MAVGTSEPATSRSLPRLVALFSPREWAKLGGLYGFIALLHVVGWGLFVGVASRYPAFAGAGVLAYTFGLRHAFDADHISAIDDTTRFMLQKGKRPLGVGFFFSLGHSSIVLALCLGLAVAAQAIESHIADFQRVGGTIGASVSGVFLWLIGILNLIVLLEIIKLWRQVKTGSYHREHLEELLLQRGLVNRLLGGRAQRFINHSWQLYPLGLLFGLGFDTASEIGLLVLTGGVATQKVSFLKIWYNITTTSLSVAVALIIGSIEIVQVLSGKLGWQGPFFTFLNQRLDFGVLGYIIVGMFLGAWLVSVVLWKIRRVEDRYGDAITDATEA